MNGCVYNVEAKKYKVLRASQSVFVPLTALYTFLPLVLTVSINCLVSTAQLCKQRQQDQAGCAGCRLQGGHCRDYQHCRIISGDRARLDTLVKMKTVRLTVFTAFGFLLCQVNISVIIRLNILSQIPSSVLWLLAWQSDRREDLDLSPVLIEVSMATRFLYIVIVPMLHGSVVDNRHRTIPTNYKSSKAFCITKFS